MVKVIRLIATFYSSYALASLVITLSCISIVFKWGSDTFTMIFWLKILTYGFIIYYMQYFKDDVSYYYKNLGLSKKHLWVSTITFDIIIFLLLTVVTLKVR